MSSAALRYAWRDLRFDLPVGVEDQTVLSLVDASDSAHPLSISVSAEPLSDASAGALERYVDLAVTEAAQHLRVLKVLERQAESVGTANVLWLSVMARADNAKETYQHHAHVMRGDTVYVFGVTSDEHASARARQVLLSLIQTLAWDTK